MRKAIIATLILLLVFVSSVFCDVTTLNFMFHRDIGGSNVDFKMSFTGYYTGQSADKMYSSYAKRSNSTSELSFGDSNLSTPVLGFAVWIKNTFNFSLKFSFSRMQMVKNAVTYYGNYAAKVYQPIFFNTNDDKKTYSESCSNLNESSDDNHGVVTVLATSPDGGSITVNFNDRKCTTTGDNPITTKTWPYNGSAFNDGDPGYDKGREGWLYPIAFNFMLGYPEKGTYSATIKVEVISNT